jgi:hypothetical protein
VIITDEHVRISPPGQWHSRNCDRGRKSREEEGDAGVIGSEQNDFIFTTGFAQNKRKFFLHTGHPNIFCILIR